MRVREIIPPTPEELGRLLEAAHSWNKDLASLIHVAVTTGCRRGELCGLRWSDINFDHAALTVTRSLSDAGGALTIKGTKTSQSRQLALDPSTIAVLQQHRQRAERRCTAAGVELAASAYVWSQDLDSSTPYIPSRITGRFRDLTKGLGLSHITFHSLRHFSATTLAGQGVGVRTIAGRQSGLLVAREVVQLTVDRRVAGYGLVKDPFVTTWFPPLESIRILRLECEGLLPER